MNILLALSLLLVSAPGPVMTQEGMPRVVASGTATVDVEADRAVLTVSVETRADSAADAAEENARRTQRVLDALDDAGYDGDEVRTSGYNLWPFHQRDMGEPSYQATNTVVVQVDDIDDLGEVIDEVIAAGANSIPSVRFVSDDLEEARHRALERAIRSAREDAEVMASAVGGRLGDLIEVTTEWPQPGPMRDVMMAEATPIAGPVESVTAHVVTIWQLRR